MTEEDETLKVVEIVKECMKRIEELDKTYDKSNIDLDTLKRKIEEVRPYAMILTSKWIPEILYALMLKKELGFNELKQILGISSRVLSDKLQSLVEMGLVERSVEQQSKAYRVRYRLTEKGRKVVYALTPFLIAVYINRW